jgi:D-lactate dehydrogenase (cytochrome)
MPGSFFILRNVDLKISLTRNILIILTNQIFVVQFSEDLEKYRQYLNDESNIAQGTQAQRVWFPSNHDEIVEVVKLAASTGTVITTSGGGTGISGGRAPVGGWVIATDRMTAIDHPHREMWTDNETGIEYGVRFFSEGGKDLVRVPVGMPLKSILNCCREKGLLYPPDPTERSSYIGGNMATNASGARSFKFGATRNWVESAHLVLADGTAVELNRSDEYQQPVPGALSFTAGAKEYNVPLPDLELPNVTKHVAGPVLTQKSHPLDIFIGTNGIFGVASEITLRLLPLPTKIISMFAYCTSNDQAYQLITRSQRHRSENLRPMPMSVELLDASAIEVMRQKDQRLGDHFQAVILLEQDVYSDEEEEEALEVWSEIFEEYGIDEISVALSHKENEHHKFLRHWVPEYLIANAKKYGYPLVVSDTSVPQERFIEFMEYLENVADEFLRESNDDLSTMLLGHVGDSHPHLALIPTNDTQAALSQRLLLEIIDKTEKMFDGQPAIMRQYGQHGLDVVHAMKQVLDPDYMFCPGNVVPVPS